MHPTKRVDPAGFFVGCAEQFTASRGVPQASAIRQQTSQRSQQSCYELSYMDKHTDYVLTNGCAQCSSLRHVFHGPYYEYEFFRIRITITTRQPSYVRGNLST
jgi:hypothetical protein